SFRPLFGSLRFEIENAARRIRNGVIEEEPYGNITCWPVQELYVRMRRRSGSRPCVPSGASVPPIRDRTSQTRLRDSAPVRSTAARRADCARDDVRRFRDSVGRRAALKVTTADDREPVGT